MTSRIPAGTILEKPSRRRMCRGFVSLFPCHFLNVKATPYDRHQNYITPGACFFPVPLRQIALHLQIDWFQGNLTPDHPITDFQGLGRLTGIFDGLRSDAIGDYRDGASWYS